MNSVDCFVTYCVRRVNAALVIEVGRLSPFVISLQIFLLITSTRPPFSVTSLYSMYRSRTCLAMMGMRLTGVPMQEKGGGKKNHYSANQRSEVEQLSERMLYGGRFYFKMHLCMHFLTWSVSVGKANIMLTISLVCVPGDANRNPTQKMHLKLIQSI